MNNSKFESSLPLVTIITPSYNQGKFIKQTIDSVISQSYKHIEYWVIDGGSTDETLEIIASYGSTIHFVSEKDQGQTNAINKGFRKSTGEIISFINSDDILLPGAIQFVVDTFLRTNALWVTGDYCIIDAQGKQIQAFVAAYKRFLRNFSSRPLLNITNYIAQPSTFWRRDLMNQLGLFDESLRYTMDYDYWLRAYRIASPIIIKEKLTAFRIHEASKGGSQFVQQFDEELQVLCKYFPNRIEYLGHKLHNSLIKSVYRAIK